MDQQKDQPEGAGKPKHAGGRPTLFKEEYIKIVFGYALLGATNERMAELFGVSRTAFNVWIKTYEEFRSSIKSGRDDADAEVTKSLYQRAKGYTVREVSYEKIGSKEEAMEISAAGEIEEVTDDMFKIKISVKQVLPEPVAAFFWLKNRQPALWRDKQHIEANHTGTINFIEQPDASNAPLSDE